MFPLKSRKAEEGSHLMHSSCHEDMQTCLWKRGRTFPPRPHECNYHPLLEVQERNVQSSGSDLARWKHNYKFQEGYVHCLGEFHVGAPQQAQLFVSYNILLPGTAFDLMGLHGWCWLVQVIHKQTKGNDYSSVVWCLLKISFLGARHNAGGLTPHQPTQHPCAALPLPTTFVLASSKPRTLKTRFLWETRSML